MTSSALSLPEKFRLSVGVVSMRGPRLVSNSQYS
jgi:hypothetical protein